MVCKRLRLHLRHSEVVKVNILFRIENQANDADERADETERA